MDWGLGGIKPEQDRGGMDCKLSEQEKVCRSAKKSCEQGEETVDTLSQHYSMKGGRKRISA